MRRYRLAVACLTLAALALRLAGMRESLFGDELFTYELVTGHGLSDAVGRLADTEVTPPLYTVLAWVTAKIGDPTLWIRLPSLAFGTLTIPLTYVLGARTVGRPAALVGAAVLTIAPFAIFYSTEARAYATLAFLVLVSTLALLRALETGEARWWAAFGVAAALALYAHYTAIFALGAQAGWAAFTHRDRLRTLVLVHGAVAAAYVPWLPGYLDQRDNLGAKVIEAFSPLSFDSFTKGLVRAFPGHPFVTARKLPGDVALVVLALALVATIALLAARGLRRPSRSFTLVAALALATPVGVLAYSAVGDNIFISRNLIASLPAFALLLGALLTSLGRPGSAVAIAVVFAALGVGTVKILETGYGRPGYRDAAHLIDRRGGPLDPVVEGTLLPTGEAPSRNLQAHFDRPHRVFRLGVDQPSAWQGTPAGRRIFLVVPRASVFRAEPLLPGLPPGFRAVDRVTYSGFVPLSVYTFKLPPP